MKELVVYAFVLGFFGLVFAKLKKDKNFSFYTWRKNRQFDINDFMTTRSVTSRIKHVFRRLWRFMEELFNE